LSTVISVNHPVLRKNPVLQDTHFVSI